MKQLHKRLFSVMLAVALVIVCLPIHFTASAVSLFDQRVSALREKFPNGAYWNHAVYEDWQRADVLLADWNNAYGDSVTWTPCATHNGQPGYGQCDCNVFDGGMQCWGFANRIFYGIFGVYASTVGNRWDKENVAIGDWIRVENDQHSAVVLKRNGNTLTIVEGNRDGNCKIVWDRQINVSSITYFKHSPNWKEIVEPLQPVDLGTNFYAYIVKTDKWIHLENRDRNLQLAMNGNARDPRQIFLFTRQGDGSYEIKSAYDDKCIDASGYGTTDGTNVQLYTDSDNQAQRWIFTGNGDGYMIHASYCDKVIDVTGGKNTPGNNIQLWSSNGTVAQTFSVYKLSQDNVTYSKPAKPAASTLTLETLGGSGQKTWFMWTESPLKSKDYDAREYDIRIYKGTSASGTAYKEKLGLTTTMCNETLEAGTYTAQVASVNTKYYNYYTLSNTVTFTVAQDYTVTYNANGATSGTAPAKQTKVSGKSLTLAKNTGNLAKTGYILDGWATSATGAKAYDLGGTYTANANVTLYAHWVKAPDTSIAIRNYTENKKVSYRTTITFSADVTNPVSGDDIHWFIDGQDEGTGETFTVQNAKKSFTVQAKYIRNGSVIAASEVENVTVDTSFVSKLIAVIRSIFGMLPKVTQSYPGI